MALIHRLVNSSLPLLAADGEKLKVKQRAQGVASRLLCSGSKRFFTHPQVLVPGEGFLEGVQVQ